MRTPEELAGPEFQTDMSDLQKEFNKQRALIKNGWSISIGFHPITLLEPQVKKLIGYFPAGEWIVYIIKNRDESLVHGDEKISVIRGMCSFGMFEAWSGPNGGIFQEPERFATAKELVDCLIERISTREKVV